MSWINKRFCPPWLDILGCSTLSHFWILNLLSFGFGSQPLFNSKLWIQGQTRWKLPKNSLFVSHCLLCALAVDTVEVFYHRSNITAARGSSVKLSCEARYILNKCSQLHAAWNLKSAELTNPKKYLTTVSETEVDDSMRSRQIETEILALTPEDSGGYQCTAECQGEDSANGHFIYIYVRGTAVIIGV